MKQPSQQKSKKSRSSRQLTLIENISVAGTSAYMAPLGLISYAKWYLAAAKSTQPPPESERPQGRNYFSPARTYLVCHALELVLKSYLSLRKMPLSTLAGGAFGHSLAALLDEAEKNDLFTNIPTIFPYRMTICDVSPYYEAKVFEYPAIGEALGGYPGNPETGPLIDAADILIAALYDSCLHAQ